MAYDTQAQMDSNRIYFRTILGTWPQVIKLGYQCGETHTANHETTIFVDNLTPTGLRKLGSDLALASERLFQRANALEGPQAEGFDEDKEAELEREEN